MADTIVHSEADERQMLASIQKWLEKKVAPVALKLEHDNEWPADLVADMTELGLFGATALLLYLHLSALSPLPPHGVLAIVLVDDPTQRTMAGALGAFQGQWGTDIPLLCAGSLLILTPTLLVFFVFQRRFISGQLSAAVKG